MAYKQKRLIVSIPGVEGVRIVIHNEDPDGIARMDFLRESHPDRDDNYLFPRHDGDALAALGFPTEPEPVETVEVEGVVPDAHVCDHRCASESGHHSWPSPKDADRGKEEK